MDTDAKILDKICNYIMIYDNIILYILYRYFTSDSNKVVFMSAAIGVVQDLPSNT